MKRGTKLERNQLKHGMIVDFTIYATSRRHARTIRGVVSLTEVPSICFDKQEPLLEGLGCLDFGLPASWYLDYPSTKSDCGDFVFQGWYKNVTPKLDNIKQTMEIVARLLAVPHVWVIEKKQATWVPVASFTTRWQARLAKGTSHTGIPPRIRKYVPAKE